MVSAVIPTLQKNKEILKLLVESLSNDICCGEIIIINNSPNPIEFDYPRLRVITPSGGNIFVNPSWNLGVKEAANDVIALLNDDIIIPENFCLNIENLITPKMGILGMNPDFVKISHEKHTPPPQTKIYLTKVNYRPFSFGCAMFFHKNSYFEIPEKMLIFCGDDWLVKMNKKVRKQNYLISGQEIIHIGSLSSSETKFNKFFKQDIKIFRKLTIKWYHRLLFIEEQEHSFKCRFLGITFYIKKTKDILK